MTSSTIYTVLGMLAIEPMSGYAVKKEVEQTLSSFWNESKGQIYPALKKAVAEGLAEVETHTSGQTKNVYTITEKGRQVLTSWLELPPEKFVVRNELMLKTFLGNNADISVTIRHLEDALIQLQKNRQKFTPMEKLVKEYIEQYKHPGGHYWHITLQCGIARLEATIKWCQESIEYLKQIQQ